ncbi:MAG: ABC transporter permease [Oscillospiraceae bacterium]|nr:ABC transporter permease [Oscillospiraceae bacterium]
MKNSNLRGVGTVFRYTVQQHYKNTSVKVFLLILFVLAVASLPAIAFASGGKSEVTETKITQLYLRNECGFPLDEKDVHSDKIYAQVKIKPTEQDDKALAKTLDEEKTAAAAVITLNNEKMQFHIKTTYGQDGEITSSDAAALNGVLEEALHKALLRSLSVTEAQEATVRSTAVSQVSKISDFLRGAEEVGTDTHVFANMFYCYLIIMLTSLSMGYIFQLCMEEKVSKLVESLLVSVTPLALLTGKILAVTVFIFGGAAVIAVGFVISYFAAQQFFSLDTIRAVLEKMLSFKLSALHISAGTILLLLVCVLLAYAMCASLSGIVGSCCSKTEDTQQASLVVVMFIMIGYMAGALAPMFESDGVNLFCSLFPLTSIFSAFPNFVCGKIGLPVFLLALLLQAAAVVLLARTAGKVYQMMLLYRGNVPKPKQLFAMLKEQRAAAKAAAGKEDTHGAE